MPGLKALGGGVFLEPVFYLTESRSLSVVHLITCKYNVCSIKLETKVLHLPIIWVYTILLFLVNKYAVHNFWLVPVNVLHTDFTCSVYCPINLTCSLRCIITIINYMYILYTGHCKRILRYMFKVSSKAAVLLLLTFCLLLHLMWDSVIGPF